MAFKGGTTNDIVLKESGLLNNAEVYDAEIHGAMAGLKAVLAEGKDHGQAAIHILLDNASAAKALQSGRTISSAWRVESFRKLVYQTSAQILIKWIPGHEEIPGNEIADLLAREELRRYNSEGVTVGEPSRLTTIAATQHKARSLASQLTVDWWSSACPQRYLELELKMRRKQPPELARPRAIYARLIAARTGHGGFAAYHRRWNHENASLHCVCGREKSVGHLVQCRKAQTNWRNMSGRRIPPAINIFLGQTGWKLFGEYVQGSGIYEEACPGMAGIKRASH